MLAKRQITEAGQLFFLASFAMSTSDNSGFLVSSDGRPNEGRKTKTKANGTKRIERLAKIRVILITRVRKERSVTFTSIKYK